MIMDSALIHYLFVSFAFSVVFYLTQYTDWYFKKTKKPKIWAELLFGLLWPLIMLAWFVYWISTPFVWLYKLLFGRKKVDKT